MEDNSAIVYDEYSPRKPEVSNAASSVGSKKGGRSDFMRNFQKGRAVRAREMLESNVLMEGN